MPKRNSLLAEDLNTPEAVLRAAAAMGPGYRGQRSESDPVRRQLVAAALANFGLEVPAYLDRNPAWVDRRAKIFEAGNYPDKGLEVSPDDLQRLAAGFDLPVPVLIEHAESPIQLGYLTQIEASGAELFGLLSLTSEANALLEQSESRSLSVGLAPDLSEIVEVSIVRHPRVASARMFQFSVPFREGESNYWKRQYEALAHVQREDAAARQVAEYVKQGRLLPAQAQVAQALLALEGAVHFDGERQSVARLVTALLEKMPVHRTFNAPVPDLEDFSPQLLMPEEAAFYRRHFPDLDLNQIAARR